MTREALKEILESEIQCYYDGVYVVEYSGGSIYLEDMSEVEFNDIKWDFFFKFEPLEETPFPSDLREIIKVLNKQSKEYRKFEQGKNFSSICEDCSNVILSEDTVEELYDFDNLRTFNLVIKNFVRIKD